jgi:predicted AAA+ superfamily ATPase
MKNIRRLFDPPDHSYFLFGPRGVGKTTWLNSAYPEALYLDLLEADRFRELSAQPERLESLVLARSGRQVVVIDEVQRIPQLLHVVHALIERKLGITFVLTGSSARKLRRGGVDLLAGRAYLCSLHPFMAVELPDFDLEKALRIGLVPLIVADSDPEAALRGYVGLYLKEEVQAEGLTRNIGQFARFLEAASFSHAATLNASQIARDCQVERKTVVAYLEILEDLLLAFRLPVFTRRAKRETIVHPKLYFFDAGVFRSLRPKGPLDRPQEIDGAALEGLVAQHLRAWIAYRAKDDQLFYWQTRGGVEVDFVLYGENLFEAIEVKNTAQIRPQDLRGLRAFGEDYPEAGLTLLYRGKDRLLLDGILCLPAEDFLEKLTPSVEIGDSFGRYGG